MSDPVLAFMAAQERFECKPLSASLTRKQCADNRARKDVLSCQNCPGLGGGVPAPSKPAPTVTLIFSDPADLDLYYKLNALSDDLSSDILALLHLAADEQIYLAEVRS